jgi:hypothetical protein
MKKSVKVKATSKPTVIMGATKKLPSNKLSDLLKSKSSKADPEEEVVKKKKKKSKEGKETKAASARASNYNFPADCTSAKDHKKFRTTVRKAMAKFEDRLADAKSGKSKESEKVIRKELATYSAEVYLSTPEA